jgi:hypothetical protein
MFGVQEEFPPHLPCSCRPETTSLSCTHLPLKGRRVYLNWCKRGLSVDYVEIWACTILNYTQRRQIREILGSRRDVETIIFPPMCTRPKQAEFTANWTTPTLHFTLPGVKRIWWTSWALLHDCSDSWISSAQNFGRSLLSWLLHFWQYWPQTFCVGFKFKARGCGIPKISPSRTRQFLCPYEIHMCCTDQAISGLLQKQYLYSYAAVPQTLAEHACTIFKAIWTFSWMMYKYNVVHITLGSLELY